MFFVNEEIKKCLPKGMELIDFEIDVGHDYFRDPVINMNVRLHVNDLDGAKTKRPTNPRKVYVNAVDIVDVIYNDPATIVRWKDGTKTVVKCQDGDTYSKETGLALCIAKKVLGNKGNFNNVFKKWCEENE